jgi:peptidoglycan/xylan/chitin deacetylase (PgdA/CDA1 family)
MYFFYFLQSQCEVLKDCCTKPGLIAITFDDGPVGYTSKVLDTLDNNNCKATFHFTTHTRAKGNIKGLYRRAIDDGHTVGLRVHPGRNYDAMTSNEVSKEMQTQANALKDAVGEDVRYARAPVENGEPNYDVYNSLAKRNITQTGYMYCLYDDAQTPEEAISNYTTILKDSNPKYDSFIFLLHDQMEEGFPLLEDMITIGRNMGYEMVTLDQCLSGYSAKGGDKKSGKKQKSGVDALMPYVSFTIAAFLAL